MLILGLSILTIFAIVMGMVIDYDCLPKEQKEKDAQKKSLAFWINGGYNLLINNIIAAFL